MRDHIHRIAAAVGVALVLGLVGYEVTTFVHLRSAIERNIKAARNLVAAVEEQDRPPPVRDSSRYAGGVFAAWEDLPPCRDLKPWHFYPTAPARSARPRR